MRRYSDYDNQARAVLANAAEAAERDGRTSLDTVEIALALVSVPWPGADALASHGVDRGALERLRRHTQPAGTVDSGLSADARSMLDRAEAESIDSGRVAVTRSDLLVAIARGQSPVARLMAAKGLSPTGLRRELP